MAAYPDYNYSLHPHHFKTTNNISKSSGFALTKHHTCFQKRIYANTVIRHSICFCERNNMDVRTRNRNRAQNNEQYRKYVCVHLNFSTNKLYAWDLSLHWLVDQTPRRDCVFSGGNYKGPAAQQR